MPYLGSRISLISKSEIRYEGILFTIDTDESTVTLSRVRSFGTEDRPADYVAPRDQVYEYIKFRGSDIKDIRVCEPPKPPAPLPSGLANDPAIVQVHSAPTSVASFQPPPFSKPSFGPIGAGTASAVQGFQGYGPPVGAVPLGMPQSVQVPPIGDLVGASRSSTPAAGTRSPTIDQGVQVSQVSRDDRRQQQHHQQQHQQHQQQHQQHQQQHQQRDSRQFGQRRFYDRGSGGQDDRFPEERQNRGQQYGPQRGARGANRNSRRGRGGRGTFNNRPQRSGKNVLNFEGDYDFEQANKKFEELSSQLAKTKISNEQPDHNGSGTVLIAEEKKEDSGNETGEGNVESEEQEESPIFYDRAKSFFDNISCEASERSKGKIQRTDWRQERKLNLDTFGVASSRRGYRSRGGYYGRGYNRGYYGNYGSYNRGYNSGYNSRSYRGGRGGSGGGGNSGESGGQSRGAGDYAGAVRNRGRQSNQGKF